MKTDDIKLDFVGVGAAKAGTSWLATCLGEHPQICMAEPTALNFFCKTAIWPEFRVNSGLGPVWLAERFVRCRAGQRLGEFSPNYLCDAQAPQLIFGHNPECRLLFCFRHPVEAVASFYHQIRKEAPIAETLEGFLDDYPEIHRMGLYHVHVKAFLEVFPRERCLFLFFEDLQSAPGMVLKQCFSFLGARCDFVPPSLERRINERKIPRSKTLLSAMNWTRRLIQKPTSGPARQRWLWKLKLYRLHDWLMQQNLKPFTPPPMAHATRQRLLDLYREDTRALGRFLNRDLSDWER
jgi:sulfotransferase family protein